jgi:hypothetical protein
VSKLFSLEYPGLDWLTIVTNILEGTASVHIKFVHAKQMALSDVYEDRFDMKLEDIGVNGTALLAEAYLRRANLMVAAKAAQSLE